MNYTIYELLTGRILRQRSRPVADGPPTVRRGEGYIPGDYSSLTHKIVAGEAVLKTYNPAIIDKAQITAGTEYAMISNLSVSSRVRIQGNNWATVDEVGDGEFEFSIDTPGEYNVTCSSDLDLDIEFQVEAI